MTAIIIFCIVGLVVLAIIVTQTITTKRHNWYKSMGPITEEIRKRRRCFSDEDMKHIIIDGVGGLHFDMEYFRELPRFKAQVDAGLKCFEELEKEGKL